MKVTKQEYIDYLKVNDIPVVEKAIEDYHRNNITFEKLEEIALNENLFSIRVYTKGIKIGNILKN